jgi:small GTP-binding protein
MNKENNYLKEEGINLYPNFELIEDQKIDHDLSFKLILIGNAGVGKSSLTINAIQHTFSDNYKTTIGFEFSSLNYKMGNKIVKLQIWDTCGQEIYRSIVSNFYRSSSLALLVYSIDK